MPINKFLQQKIFNFDLLLALRGVSALIVVLGHMNLSKDFILKSHFTKFDGGLSVVLFFILSSYLMVKLFSIGRYKFGFVEILEFYKQRINRIFPLYWTILFILMISTNLLEPANLHKFFEFLSFTQYYWSNNDYPALIYNQLAPAWSLIVELQFYLIVPIFAWFFIKLNTLNYWFKSCLILILISSFWLVRKSYWLDLNLDYFKDFRIYKSLLPYFPYFLAGGVAHYLVVNYKSFFAKFTFLLPFLFLVPFLAPFLISEEYMRNWNNQKHFITLISGTLLIAIFESFSYQNKPAKWNYTFLDIFKPRKLLEILGHLSFGAYLWHMTFSIAFHRQFNAIPRFEFPQNQVDFLLISCVLLATYFTSYISFITVEKLKFIK
jgi:peptidoglycan/LPS O-acetylase OafA/YrhL